MEISYLAWKVRTIFHVLRFFLTNKELIPIIIVN